jgi:uncharacterized membrane protein YccF (DUF307 family)
MSESRPTTIVVDQRQPGCLITVLWFIFIGSWLSAIWVAIAWVLIVLIVTMPIGLAMMHRVPRIATLRAPSREYVVATQGTATRIQEVPVPQRPFLIRAIYFLVIGWWFSALWIIVAWATTATIVLLPLSIWMMNRIPAVTTLQRY